MGVGLGVGNLRGFEHLRYCTWLDVWAPCLFFFAFLYFLRSLPQLFFLPVFVIPRIVTTAGCAFPFFE